MIPPERPLLRNVDPRRVRHEGESLLLLHDPQELVAAPLVVSHFALAVMAWFDGRRTLPDVQAELQAAHGVLVPLEDIERVARALDEAGYLAGPAADALRDDARRRFRALERRPIAHGGSYPVEPEELCRWYDDLAAPAAPLATSADAPPVAAAAPHIDPRFGGASSARVHAALARHADAYDTVVVLGTGHAAGDDLLTLTRLDYDTPLGPVETDRELVDAISTSVGPAHVYRSEHLHGAEHSVEFQAVYLALEALRLRRKPPRIVPVLVGSLHEFVAAQSSPAADARLAAFTGAFFDETKRLGRRALVLASIDLAHLGPRYGDPEGNPLTPRELAAADRALLAHAQRGDAEAFFAHNAAEDDRRRICGFSALYLSLRLAPGARGTVHRYEQTTFPGTADTVSHVGMTFGAR